MQDFHSGGVGRKRLCARRNITNAYPIRRTLRPGSRAHLRDLEALGVFSALSCHLSLMFNYSDKWDLKNIVDQNLWGCEPAAPPAWSATLLNRSWQPLLRKSLVKSCRRLVFNILLVCWCCVSCPVLFRLALYCPSVHPFLLLLFNFYISRYSDILA